MNWENLKEEIRDLGFETDEIFEEYESVIINACNRAMKVIRHTIIARHEDYFPDYFDIEYNTLVDYTPITADTTDDTVIEIPEKLEVLLPLLASHYVWLDDDQVKSMLYWNEYDDLKNQLEFDIASPRRCIIDGGF